MTRQLIDWWQARTPREQYLLGVMIILLLALLLWLLILRPLDRATLDARDRHEAAVERLAEARRRFALFDAGRAAGRSQAPTPVDAFLLRTARDAGFEPRLTVAGPDRASLALASARPQPLLAWIALMERRGLVVRQLRTQANADRTLNADISFGVPAQ